MAQGPNQSKTHRNPFKLDLSDLLAPVTSTLDWALSHTWHCHHRVEVGGTDFVQWARCVDCGKGWEIRT